MLEFFLVFREKEKSIVFVNVINPFYRNDEFHLVLFAIETSRRGRDIAWNSGGESKNRKKTSWNRTSLPII